MKAVNNEKNKKINENHAYIIIIRMNSCRMVHTQKKLMLIDEKK